MHHVAVVHVSEKRGCWLWQLLCDPAQGCELLLRFGWIHAVKGRCVKETSNCVPERLHLRRRNNTISDAQQNQGHTVIVRPRWRRYEIMPSRRFHGSRLRRTRRGLGLE